MGISSFKWKKSNYGSVSGSQHTHDLLKRINRFFFWSLRSISSKPNKSFNSVAHAHLSVAETHFVQFFKKNITRHFGFNALKKHRIISVRVKHISPGTTLNTLFQTFRNSWLVNVEFFFFSPLFLLFLLLLIQSNQYDHATGYNLNTISSKNVLESSIIALRKAIKWFHLQLWSTTSIVLHSYL